jgi:hypothetical protein
MTVFMDVLPIDRVFSKIFYVFGDNKRQCEE